MTKTTVRVTLSSLCLALSLCPPLLSLPTSFFAFMPPLAASLYRGSFATAFAPKVRDFRVLTPRKRVDGDDERRQERKRKNFKDGVFFRRRLGARFPPRLLFLAPQKDLAAPFERDENASSETSANAIADWIPYTYRIR